MEMRQKCTMRQLGINRPGRPARPTIQADQPEVSP
jgi:hypothetical protein